MVLKILSLNILFRAAVQKVKEVGIFIPCLTHCLILTETDDNKINAKKHTLY